MKTTPIEQTFDADWKKAVLFVALVCDRLPPWVSGKEGWKALAALTDWRAERCHAALEEALYMGMIDKAETYEDTLPF